MTYIYMYYNVYKRTINFVITAELLICMDSNPFCVEYSGESFKRENIDHTLSYDSFYVLGFILSISGNVH